MTNAHLQNTPISSGARGRSPERRRLTVNITPIERIGWVILGVAVFAVAAVLLGSAASPIAVVLEVLLALTGLDLAVTGALGHCPLYQKLGFVFRSLRGPS